MARCRTITVDGQLIRYQGDKAPTADEAEMIRELLRAAVAMPIPDDMVERQAAGRARIRAIHDRAHDVP